MSLHIKILLQYSTGFRLQLNQHIQLDKITALFGASGSGKTSLLRCIAGLEANVVGDIQYKGETWLTAKKRLAAHKRPIAYVFQEASLFEHLSVEGNLRYASKRASKPLGESLKAQILEILGIKDLLARKPAKLSGGERQRVAIARAMFNSPELLLMDEPLAALDAKRKQGILQCIKDLHLLTGIPIIYVSHSMEEVAWLADEVLLFENGEVQNQGTPEQVFSSRSSQDLLDDFSVLWQGRIESLDSQWGLHKVNVAGQSLQLPDNGQPEGSLIRLKIAASDVSLSLEPTANSSILNRLDVTITSIEKESDASCLLSLSAGEKPLYARLTHLSVRDLGLQVGSKCWAQIKSVAVVQ
jgi:molybdate transport system ATP-binding protein